MNMHIVHIINRFIPFVGGAELYAYNLSKELVKRGHKVTVLTTNSMSFRGTNSVLAKQLPKYEYIDGIEIIRRDAYINLPGIVISKDISIGVLKQNADIFNIHGFLSNISFESALFLRGLKKKIVLILHDVSVDESRGYYPLWKIYSKTAGKILCEVVDTIIAQNPIDANFLIETLRIPKNKIFIIPNGIDVNLYCSENVNEKK